MSVEPRVLRQWVIYDHPRDFPAHFVVRGWSIQPGAAIPDGAVQLALTLDEARQLVPPGMYRLDRQPDDDPSIAEVWT